MVDRQKRVSTANSLITPSMTYFCEYFGEYFWINARPQESEVNGGIFQYAKKKKESISIVLEMLKVKNVLINGE